MPPRPRVTELRNPLRQSNPTGDPAERCGSFNRIGAPRTRLRPQCRSCGIHPNAQVVRRRKLSTLEQSRYLATAIPGPRSKELIDRKIAAVSRGIGNTMPVYAARAGGGIVEDVDGNRLIDLGSGIAVTTIGNSSPRVVEAVRAAGRRLHPHLLHDHAVRGVRRRRRTAQPPHAGELREAFGAVQLGVGGGGERDQDRQDIHPQAGGGGVRPRLPRPHQPDDGPDREVDALQTRLRPVRPGDLPCAAVLPVPRRRVRQGDGDRR